MVRRKTGRPTDIPFGSGLRPERQDFEQRIFIVSSGSITRIYTTEISNTTITNSYTLSNETVLLVDASAHSVTVTLPTAASKNQWWYYIKKIDTSNHTVKIKADSADEIDKEDEYDISIPMTCITITSDGDDWWII